MRHGKQFVMLLSANRFVVIIISCLVVLFAKGEVQQAIGSVGKTLLRERISP